MHKYLEEVCDCIEGIEKRMGFSMLCLRTVLFFGGLVLKPSDSVLIKYGSFKDLLGCRRPESGISCTLAYLRRCRFVGKWYSEKIRSKAEIANFFVCWLKH